MDTEGVKNRMRLAQYGNSLNEGERKGVNHGTSENKSFHIKSMSLTRFASGMESPGVPMAKDNWRG